ncbi:MAG: 2,5-diamino-6-(ribosylamino)-4(3H)-pyrimidinone 5'-phosphate reductase [Halobacteriales archaeon]
MHVRVNAATSVDGKLASRRREQVRLSGPEDFERVDRLRADHDAVMVGVGTVLADDPSLTVDDPDLVAAREDRGESPQPARVVADSRGRTPPDARILSGAAPTYLLVGGDAAVDPLRTEGVTVVRTDGRRVDLAAGLAALEERGVERLMVEGGGELLFSLFAADLVDELSVYVAPTVIGGRDAPTLADGEGFVGEFPTLSLVDTERVDDGVLLRYEA